MIQLLYPCCWAKSLSADWLTALIAVASLIVLFRCKVSKPLLIAVIAVVGMIAFSLLKPARTFVR
jgi:chromate transport protein ChrA